MKILVVAPHADDESLGCGGTLLRMRTEQPTTELHWILVTNMSARHGHTPAQVNSRNQEIAAAASRLGVAAVHDLGFAPARLDTVPMAELVSAVAGIVSRLQPHTLFVPYCQDAHSDHRVTFDAVAACTKSFRYPSIRRVAAYETISETELSIDPSAPIFRPNLWVDISGYLDAKLDLVACYASEIAAFPFPRSREAIVALARLRGSTVNVAAAEAFMLLKEII